MPVGVVKWYLGRLEGFYFTRQRLMEAGLGPLVTRDESPNVTLNERRRALALLQGYSREEVAIILNRRVSRLLAMSQGSHSTTVMTGLKVKAKKPTMVSVKNADGKWEWSRLPAPESPRRKRKTSGVAVERPDATEDRAGPVEMIDLTGDVRRATIGQAQRVDHGHFRLLGGLKKFKTMVNQRLSEDVDKEVLVRLGLIDSDAWNSFGIRLHQKVAICDAIRSGQTDEAIAASLGIRVDQVEWASRRLNTVVQLRKQNLGRGYPCDTERFRGRQGAFTEEELAILNDPVNNKREKIELAIILDRSIKSLRYALKLESDKVDPELQDYLIEETGMAESDGEVEADLETYKVKVPASYLGEFQIRVGDIQAGTDADGRIEDAIIALMEEFLQANEPVKAYRWVGQDVSEIDADIDLQLDMNTPDVNGMVPLTVLKAVGRSRIKGFRGSESRLDYKFKGNIQILPVNRRIWQRTLLYTFGDKSIWSEATVAEVLADPVGHWMVDRAFEKFRGLVDENNEFEDAYGGAKVTDGFKTDPKKEGMYTRWPQIINFDGIWQIYVDEDDVVWYHHYKNLAATKHLHNFPKGQWAPAVIGLLGECARDNDTALSDSAVEFRYRRFDMHYLMSAKLPVQWVDRMKLQWTRPQWETWRDDMIRGYPADLQGFFKELPKRLKHRVNLKKEHKDRFNFNVPPKERKTWVPPRLHIVEKMIAEAEQEYGDGFKLFRAGDNVPWLWNPKHRPALWGWYDLFE